MGRAWLKRGYFEVRQEVANQLEDCAYEYHIVVLSEVLETGVV